MLLRRMNTIDYSYVAVFQLYFLPRKQLLISVFGRAPPSLSALTVLDPPSPDADPDAADADAGADADGPFLTVCSRCSNGYRARGYFACSNCPYKVPAAVVAVMSVMAIFVLAILVPMMLSNWESEATDVRGLGVLAPWKRRLHSLKVVIVSWQALTQVRTRDASLLTWPQEAGLNARPERSSHPHVAKNEIPSCGIRQI